MTGGVVRWRETDSRASFLGPNASTLLEKTSVVLVRAQREDTTQDHSDSAETSAMEKLGSILNTAWQTGSYSQEQSGASNWKTSPIETQIIGRGTINFCLKEFENFFQTNNNINATIDDIYGMISISQKLLD